MDELIKYFKGDEFAASTWLNKYALKDKNGNVIEKTPDDMHRRLAKEFARIENSYNDIDKMSEDDIFELFKDFKYVIPGGSVLSGLGNNKPVSLSNCFVIDSPKDSYDSIMKTRNYQCQLMKRRGGVGYDLSLLRPRGAKVNNAANTSTGAASFMDANSTLTNEVAQGGRRGALMNTIEINHPDVQEFIEKKQDLTKVTGANISVKINDAFMYAVEKKEDYILRWPTDVVFDDNLFKTDEYPYDTLINVTNVLNNEKTVYIKKVNAKTLWNKLVHCAWNTAEPGVIFVDKMHNYAPDGVYENYKMVSTNPCGEIGMNKDSCRLIAMNLSSYVVNPYTDKAYFNNELFTNHVYKAVKLGDDLVDLELEQVNKILSGLNEEDISEKEIWTTLKNTAINVRRMGLGFTGLGDMLAMMGMKYGTTESTTFLENVLKVWFGEQLRGTIKLARMRGTFNKFDANLEGGSDFNTPQNDFFKMIYENYNKEWQEMMKYGRRNISWSTLAPCGSLSILTRTTSGVEPLFMPFYERKRKCVNENDRVDYIDKVGEKYTTFVIVHNGLKEWAHINQGLSYNELNSYNIQQWQTLYEKSPYYNACAQDLDWHTRNDIQGLIQKYITHSISSTCNLANDITEGEVSELYIDAWKKGCKGTTIYRDGCREGVLTQLTKKKEDDKFNESDVNAPKRPKSLEADFYTTKVKGEMFYVMIGLYQNKPYEIFVYRPNGVVTFKNIKNHKGVLTKVKKNHYRFDSDILSIDDLSSKLNTEELATVLYSSMLMRTGAKLKYIVKVSKKVDDNISSFTAAMNRIISKYIPNEVIEGETCPECGSKIIRENGCQHCSQCEWSKCE